MMSLFFAFICCLCLGISSLITYYKDEKREYDLIIGKVVRIDESNKGHHSIGYVPVIEYYYRNKVYQVNHRISSSKYGKNMEIVPGSKYHIGDEVELRVYVDKPEYAIVNDKNNIRLPLYIGVPLVLLSAVLLCVGINP